MFSAIILMCTADMWCYTIINESGFYDSQTECVEAIKQLITDESFDSAYRLYEEGVTFDVYDTRCVEWKKTGST